MARVPITVMGCKCEKCSFEWIPEDSRTEPEGVRVLRQSSVEQSERSNADLR